MVKYNGVYGKKKPLFTNIVKRRNGDEISMKQAFECEVLEKFGSFFADIVERWSGAVTVWHVDLSSRDLTN